MSGQIQGAKAGTQTVTPDGRYTLVVNQDGSLNVVASGGGGTQYAEDSVAADGSLVTLAGVVRQDTPASNGADGDVSWLKVDTLGRLYTAPMLGAQIVSGTTGATPLTDTTSTSIIAAGGAGVITYLTGISITNGHATVDTRVQILDGSTVKFEMFAKAAGGGGVFPVLLRGTANTIWNAKCVTTGSSVDVNLNGYQSTQ
jgi:hypothetical protein